MNELDFGKRKVEEMHTLMMEECCFAEYIYMEEQGIPVCLVLVAWHWQASKNGCWNCCMRQA